MGLRLFRDSTINPSLFSWNQEKKTEENFKDKKPNSL